MQIKLSSLSQFSSLKSLKSLTPKVKFKLKKNNRPNGIRMFSGRAVNQPQASPYGRV